MPTPRDISITYEIQPELPLTRRGKRLAKPPPPLEFQLQIAIMGHFRWRKAPGWKGFHTANGEKRDKRTGAKLKAMGVEPGVPDLVFIAPNARAHFLEIKRRGERILPDSPQDLFRQHAELFGWPWAWADDLNEALSILEGWRCLLPNLSVRRP
jgi:hypothetical protein